MTDQADASTIVRRAAPELFILDADLHVVSTSRGAAWLDDAAESGQFEELALAVRRALSEPLPDIMPAGEPETMAGVAIGELFGETTLLRVLPLHGAPAGHIAVLSERLQLRDPITRAAAHFNLSPRERDVLREVMLGHGTSQIAERLAIAETTVADHVKRIAMKTDSHRRSEIIAKVLGTR
ncbi:MAG: helix-turn-helix transcriptional regulator [Candidatus Eremiobacteraeota bacterium]|nr:helix-turn-helix transcriptional regulator [Candidatus Eremiobacteraeota bacterium]